MNNANTNESILLDMARSWDACERNNKTNKQSDKDKRALPQLDDREVVARKANKLADLCRGMPMSGHDERNGYKREYIQYMLATQIMHQVRIMYKQSFNSKN